MSPSLVVHLRFQNPQGFVCNQLVTKHFWQPFGALGAYLVETWYPTKHPLASIGKGNKNPGGYQKRRAVPPRITPAAPTDIVWQLLPAESSHSTSVDNENIACGLQIQGRCDVTTCQYVGSGVCILRWVQNWVQFLQRNPEFVEIVASWERLPAPIREAMAALRRTAAAKR